jgi:hypothetical protein
MLKTDRVKFTDKTVEAYGLVDLQRLFAKASQDESDMFQFLVRTYLTDYGQVKPNRGQSPAKVCSRSARSMVDQSFDPSPLGNS